MATLKGKWRFNDVLTLQVLTEYVTFYSFNGSTSAYQTFYGFYIERSDQLLNFMTAEDNSTRTWVVTERGMWRAEQCKIVDFGSEPQSVSDEFYAWFKANATPLVIKAGTYRFKEDLSYEAVASTVHIDIAFSCVVNGEVKEYVQIIVQPDENLITYYSEANARYHTSYSSGWGNEAYRTIIIAEDTEVYDATLCGWFTANTDEMKQISGMWKFNETLTRGIGGDVAPFVSNGRTYIKMRVSYSGNKNWICLNYFTAEDNDDLTTADNIYYFREYEGNPAGWTNTAYRTIEFLPAEQVVTLEFYAWLTENAVPVNSSSGAIGGSEAWWAENFPNDIWSDGEASLYVGEYLWSIRYKYRKGKTDPKDIDITDENGIGLQIKDVNGTDALVTTLLEYYTYGMTMICGRLWVECGSALADILNANPVVITYCDISEWASSAFGREIKGTLHAAQASLKNYDGLENPVNHDTVVSYVANTEGEGLPGDFAARYLYVLGKTLCTSFYYEETDNVVGGSYAYIGYEVNPFNDLSLEDSPLPIEVATEGQMAYLLATADVGSIYKYTGTTTETYENGALYIIEAVSQ